MRTTITGMIVGAVAMATMSTAIAADSVRLQLKWVPQAQFAGYFVAKAKGFYDEADLDVTLLSGGPNVSVPQVMAGGGADVAVEWMASALVAREKGVPMVNIAQPYSKSGLMMICPTETGIKSPDDFPGHTLGVWFFGNEYPFFAWMNKLGLATDGSDGGVTVLQQSYDIQPMVQGQADCISVMTYNEYGQALDAGYGPDNLSIFNYSEMGNDLLEDGLYVMEDRLDDPAFADQMVRFVSASMKGWQYAEEHPEEAAQIIVDADATGAAEYEHQLYMAGEVSKLIDANNPALDQAVYDRTAKALLDQKIIQEPPSGAFTTAITDKVGGM